MGVRVEGEGRHISAEVLVGRKKGQGTLSSNDRNSQPVILKSVIQEEGLTHAIVSAPSHPPQTVITLLCPSPLSLTVCLHF